MLAILSAPGSRGDVNPMIAIGRQLRAEGIDVVISLAQPYAEIARQADLQVEPVIDRERFDSMLSNASIWHPVHGARLLLREVCVDFLPLHDAIIRKHHRPGDTVLVSHPLDLASRVYRELDPSTPLVDVHLAPVILRTPRDPARMSPWWFEPSRPAWTVRGLHWIADQFGADPVIRAPLNRFRATHGLAPIRRVFHSWHLSPDRILAMYPPWFAPATMQFSPRLVHAGFPLCDADDREFALPTNRPIVFTAGTAHHHSRQFFSAAVQSCNELGKPGLLVSSHAANFPANLPSSIQTVSYAPFGKLLPHCSAIVHHGGIGTTSQAFAAGIPQVVRPLAFDQFDNATRVERLGCGAWLGRDKDLTGLLERTINSTSVADRCAEIASRLTAEPAAIKAAHVIRQTIHHHNSPETST